MTKEQRERLEWLKESAIGPEYRHALDALLAAFDDRAEDAIIAWSVCASVHREYCRKTDPLFTTRQGDFVKHESDARAAIAATNAQAGGDNKENKC